MTRRTDEEGWESESPKDLRRKAKEKEQLGRWRFNQVGCLLCGSIFSGKTYGEALKLFEEHHLDKHEGEHDNYTAIGEPLDGKADKEARKVGAFAEALKIEKIRRDHGDGWYMFALREGINRALELIPHEEELAAQAQMIMAEGRADRKVEREEKETEEGGERWATR